MGLAHAHGFAKAMAFPKLEELLIASAHVREAVLACRFAEVAGKEVEERDRLAELFPVTFERASDGRPRFGRIDGKFTRCEGVLTPREGVLTPREGVLTPREALENFLMKWVRA
jgi:hypothetical protein